MFTVDFMQMATTYFLITLTVIAGVICQSITQDLVAVENRYLFAGGHSGGIRQGRSTPPADMEAAEAIFRRRNTGLVGLLSKGLRLTRSVPSVDHQDTEKRSIITHAHISENRQERSVAPSDLETAEAIFRRRSTGLVGLLSKGLRLTRSVPSVDVGAAKSHSLNVDGHINGIREERSVVKIDLEAAEAIFRRRNTGLVGLLSSGIRQGRLTLSSD